MKRKIRIVFDTNIWVSFLITKSLKGIDKLIFEDRIKLLFSNESLLEFIEVSSKRKLGKYFTQDDILKLIELFNEYGLLIDVRSSINVCRDFKDNFLLALAKDGNADYLITGDKDLLVLEEFEGTKIINMKQFRSTI